MHQEADELAAILTAVGLDSMIDVHTHFMPKPVMDKVWSYFDQVGPLTGREWPINYRFSETERLEVLRTFKVRRFTSLVYPHKPGMAAWLNAWATEFAAATPDCIHSATFFPEPDAGSYVTEAIEAGAKIFKAHLQVGDYSPNDPQLDEVWDVLSETQTPLVIHCGNGPAPGQFTGPAGIEKLLARFPGLRLIIAHMGLPEYAEFLDLTARYEGLHLDTTMAFTAFTEANHPFPPELRPRLVELGDRIVFGSDFPNIPYSYAEAVRAVVDLGLGDAWVRGVLHDNASRLLEIPSE
jgi:predicted TIM-barrel fold metal-dependent hydrolase